MDWNEIIERLKQKAKLIKDCIVFPMCGWGEVVRLEDVLSILQQLKQNYVVIPKEKAKKLCDLWISHIEPLDHQAENPYYFHLVLTEEEKNEFSQILKELLGFAGS